jgi:hypothetical protein
MAAPEKKKSWWEKAGDFVSNPIVSGVTGAVGGALFGDRQRDWEETNRAAMKTYGKGLRRGITEADVMRMLPIFRKAMAPYIRGAAGSASAKFGSRSSYAQGAAINAANQAISPYVASSFQDRLRNNQANLRLLFSESSRHATERGGSGLGI